MNPRTFATAAAAIMISIMLPRPASADEAPPRQAGQSALMTAQSHISAKIEFGLPAIERALERHVPRVLASFDDRATRCWRRRILRREVDVDCVFSGLVERTGPISLQAERGRLEGAVPIYGWVAGQGLGRLARLVHGAGEGALTVYAVARPRLRPDWTVALDMGEGFRWQEAPVIRVFGFNINIARYVEPRVRAQLGRVEAEAAAYLRSLDLRAKAETAWRNAFTPVKIFDTPEIWLQMTPQTVAFAGTRARGDVLEGSLEMTGTAATFVGIKPPANAPTPLPALGADVSEPGRFEIVIPVAIDFNTVRAKLQDAISAMNVTGFAVRDEQVYPSGDKVVFGLKLGSAQVDAVGSNWIYLTASPASEASNEAVEFANLKLSAAGQALPESIADWFKDDAHLKSLQDRMRVAYQDELNMVVAAANARLTRSLGDGFRSEAHLTPSGPPKIQLLDDGMRIDFRAGGDLKILYGL